MKKLKIGATDQAQYPPSPTPNNAQLWSYVHDHEESQLESLTQYEIYISFFENTLFFMGYTPKMRMMIYINTLPFASMGLSSPTALKCCLNSKYLITWSIQIKSCLGILLWSIE